jgi:hypothetical protein
MGDEQNNRIVWRGRGTPLLALHSQLCVPPSRVVGPGSTWTARSEEDTLLFLEPMGMQSVDPNMRGGGTQTSPEWSKTVRMGPAWDDTKALSLHIYAIVNAKDYWASTHLPTLTLLDRGRFLGSDPKRQVPAWANKAPLRICARRVGGVRGREQLAIKLRSSLPFFFSVLRRRKHTIQLFP